MAGYETGTKNNFVLRAGLVNRLKAAYKNKKL